MSDTRECPRCKRTMPVERFHRDRSKSSGRRSHCVDCMAEYTRGYVPTEEQERRYRAARAARPKPAGYLAGGARRARDYYYRNRHKSLARAAARYAINSGRLRRGPCELCGAAELVHAHHDDYSKPLDVRWLCRRCHVAHHSK